MAKRWALLLLLFYLCLLTVISLINLGKLPTLGSSFDDKIFHFFSHTVLTVLCFNYFRKTVTKALVWSALVPLGYGISIEWLQGFTSNLRTSDGRDVLANVLGMIFAVLFLSVVKNVKLN